MYQVYIIYNIDKSTIVIVPALSEAKPIPSTRRAAGLRGSCYPIIILGDLVVMYQVMDTYKHMGHMGMGQTMSKPIIIIIIDYYYYGINIHLVDDKHVINYGYI